MYWMMHRGAALNSLAMLLKFKAVEQWYDGGREEKVLRGQLTLNKILNKI